MTYDKATGKITIDGDEKQFELDMLKHFEEVTRQLAREPNCPPEIVEQHKRLKEQNEAFDDYHRRKSKPRRTFIDRLDSLSKLRKASFVFMVFWTAYVIYRTADSHVLMGIDLDRWYENDFFMNWLGLPAIAAVALFATRWALKDRQVAKNPAAALFTEFERDRAHWPAHQGQIALDLIGAVIKQDQELIDKLIQQLTVEQVQAIARVVQKMRDYRSDNPNV